jgi:hypothetical protein
MSFSTNSFAKRVTIPERQNVGEVPATNLVGLLLGDLLDVDAAHGREDHHGLLARAVPHNPRVVLLRDLGPGVHEHAAWHVAVDLKREDVARILLGLLGGVGELYAAGLHASAGEHLGLDHCGTADTLRDPPCLGGVGRKAVVSDWDTGALDYLARLILEESHRCPGFGLVLPGWARPVASLIDGRASEPYTTVVEFRLRPGPRFNQESRSGQVGAASRFL